MGRIEPAVAAEREACAALAEEYGADAEAFGEINVDSPVETIHQAARGIAASIRARR